MEVSAERIIASVSGATRWGFVIGEVAPNSPSRQVSTRRVSFGVTLSEWARARTAEARAVSAGEMMETKRGRTRERRAPHLLPLISRLVDEALIRAERTASVFWRASRD